MADEETSPAEWALLQSVQSGRCRLLAPSIWDYEVANGLRLAVLRGRLPEAEAPDALTVLRGLEVEIVDFASLAEHAWRIALRRRVTIYDAAYLALARARTCELCTRDNRLAKVAEEEGVAQWAGNGGALPPASNA
jgi:predicted nucleic acid-binding protein